MAENPKFNNSNMFTNVSSNDYSEVTPDNSSEVLATQGNVINSIKTFWNKLRTKLAYAISRPDYDKQVGGYYVPIFVDADGVVQECQPTTIQADIASNGIITIPTDTIPNDNIYTGTTVCISVSNNSVSGSDSNLQIQHKDSISPVKYPSGVTVLTGDISSGDLLLATFCKASSSSNNNFWILLNKINTVVPTAVDGGGHPGLMTAKDKAKLDTIDRSANNYRLPKASNTALGGIMLGYEDNDKNYRLQTDSNGKGYVNVPWTDNNHNTAYLRAGNNTSIDNGATANNNTYLKIVDGGNVSSTLKISGSGGTSVTSDNSGNITISSQESVNISSTNKDPSKKYTVKGAGNNATTNYYLAGNGTWVNGILVPIPTVEGKTLKSHANGTVSWE